MRESGSLDEAYKQMCRAAQQCPKLDMMVSFYQDFGMLAKELKKKEEAYCYLLISKLVREEKKWKIPTDLTINLEELKLGLNVEAIPQEVRSLHQKCKSYWSGNKNDNQIYRGKIQLGLKEKPFCFIYDNEKKSHYCLKKDLPVEIKNDDLVSFNLLSSFDKKKNIQSMRAINISLFKS
jgi:hypothetical protein